MLPLAWLNLHRCVC